MLSRRPRVAFCNGAHFRIIRDRFACVLTSSDANYLDACEGGPAGGAQPFCSSFRFMIATPTELDANMYGVPDESMRSASS